ncbi:Kinase D-interacting substrate of 220 kDa [Symbiodinium microadriaticum]|uniref:Kinase D-interacting substrate of 220 kDa n=1 Tax=Symbiodinium microadriaticum TaxID=2951 RepID=A0A1Q9ETH8_SYMMI|nr:Kinase D-interacting substrate of 220 kDa [Symbiodinium microadriaticum]CAE7897032.1 kidins220b [Symbiodinium microadriaticum]CAE7947941.1 kidins220b [Symbiodinium sp. KB8]
MTPLTCASAYGHVEIVRLLLEAGAAVDLTDRQGNTALTLATANGHIEALRLLLGAGANIGQTDKDGRTALSWASSIGHVKAAELLLEAGADTNATDHGLNTSLIWASANGHAEILRLLLEVGAAKNCTDHNGRTALMRAAGNGRAEAVRLLLEAGADSEIRDHQGRTALVGASAKGHSDVVRILSEQKQGTCTCLKSAQSQGSMALSNGSTGGEGDPWLITEEQRGFIFWLEAELWIECVQDVVPETLHQAVARRPVEVAETDIEHQAGPQAACDWRPDTVEVVAEEERQMQTSLEVKPGKRNPEEPDVDQLLADGDEERYYQAAKAQQEMDEDAWVTECMKREDEEARRQLVEFQAAAYKDCESWTALNTPQLEGIRKRYSCADNDWGLPGTIGVVNVDFTTTSYVFDLTWE